MPSSVRIHVALGKEARSPLWECWCVVIVVNSFELTFAGLLWWAGGEVPSSAGNTLGPFRNPCLMM